MEKVTLFGLQRLYQEFHKPDERQYLFVEVYAQEPGVMVALEVVRFDDCFNGETLWRRAALLCSQKDWDEFVNKVAREYGQAI